MKKGIVLILVAILAVAMASAVPVYADRSGHGGYHGGHHGHHERFFFGGSVFIGPDPWWWGPTYYAAPPVVVEQQPQTYIQAAPQPVEQNYWYYCTNPEGYYPYVNRCAGGWVKILPPTGPPN